MLNDKSGNANGKRSQNVSGTVIMTNGPQSTDNNYNNAAGSILNNKHK